MKLIYTLLFFTISNCMLAAHFENTTLSSKEKSSLTTLSAQFTYPVVPGYTYTIDWPSLSKEEIIDFLKMWHNLSSVASIDQAPTAGEIEIYELLKRASTKPSLPNINNYSDWGGAAAVTNNMINLEKIKDLAYLDNSILHTDMILTTRVEKVAEFTGQMEHTWFLNLKDAWNNDIETSEYLAGGFNCSAIASVAKWILEHPAIYDQIAPSDPNIPLSGFGTTYYERAEFYLMELLKAYEAWERNDAFFYEFDEANECGSWIQNSITYVDVIEDYKTIYPNGFDVKDFLDIVPYAFGPKPERQLFRAWNRQWHMNWGYLETADALLLLDANKYFSFYDRAYVVSTKVLNFWRGLRMEVIETAPIGKKYIFGYKPVDDFPNRAEDITHLRMDERALVSHRNFGLLTDEELQILSTTFTHGRYDFFNFLPYKSINNKYFLDEDGNPYDPGGSHPNKDADGPGFGDWTGEYANDEQLQFFAAKCLEVHSERLRLFENNINAYSLGNYFPLTTMGMLFSLHEAKVGRQLRNRPDNLSNTPPVADYSGQIITVSPQANEGDQLFTVVASDVDTDQNLYYAIVGGNDNYKFKIDMFTGELTLRETLDASIQDNYNLKIEITDNGIPFKSAIINLVIEVTDEVAGIDTVNNQNTIFIYPNPVLDVLNIKMKGIFKGNLSIYTTTGVRLVEENNLNSNTLKIDTSNWHSGIYFIRIYDQVKNELIVRKVIVSKNLHK